MKLRQNLYLDVDVIVSLDRTARAVRRGNPKANKSRIANDILRQGLAAEGAKQVDVVVKPALGRLAGEMATMSRNGAIHFEAFMLLVEHVLSVTPPVREKDAAARAVGEERFRRFIDKLGQRIADGGARMSEPLEGEPS